MMMKKFGIFSALNILRKACFIIIQCCGSSSATAQRTETAFTVEKLEEELESLSATVTSTSDDLSAHVETVTESLPDIGKLIKRTTELEQCKAYLKCIDKIEHAR